MSRTICESALSQAIERVTVSRLCNDLCLADVVARRCMRRRAKAYTLSDPLNMPHATGTMLRVSSSMQRIEVCATQCEIAVLEKDAA